MGITHFISCRLLVNKRLSTFVGSSVDRVQSDKILENLAVRSGSKPKVQYPSQKLRQRFLCPKPPSDWSEKFNSGKFISFFSLFPKTKTIWPPTRRLWKEKSLSEFLCRILQSEKYFVVLRTKLRKGWREGGLRDGFHLRKKLFSWP